MPLRHALTFIRRGMGDAELRDRLNAATTLPEAYEVLETEGLKFTAPEFEDAVNSTLLKCSSHEQAEHVREFRVWWETLQSVLSAER